jgi:hypothetical protein
MVCAREHSSLATEISAYFVFGVKLSISMTLERTTAPAARLANGNADERAGKIQTDYKKEIQAKTAQRAMLQSS